MRPPFRPRAKDIEQEHNLPPMMSFNDGHWGVMTGQAGLRARFLRGSAIALLLSNVAITDASVRMAAAQAGSQAISFNVRAQALGGALNAFADQAGLRLLFPSDLATGRSSPGLSGTYSREQGLSQLLAGTGLSYRFTSASTVTISGPSSSQGASTDGAIQLDTIDVSGRGGGGNSARADRPYTTPGSSSYISREQIDRLPPTSPGDVFINAPGVINGGNRVGTSLNPNIRGLQGMGRVNTTVDGALNATTSYRGYAGNRDETYVDPDMIGGIDISKGPSEGVGAGAIGGNINFRTLAAEDIVKAGNNWGIRLKGSTGTNTSNPYIPIISPVAPPVTRDTDRPTSFNGDNWSGSVAAATLQDNFEGVLAATKRQQGNYFAGSNNVPAGFVFPKGPLIFPGRNAVVRPGQEVYNTSENTETLLAKGKLKWADGRSFELGYMRYDSKAGEEDEALINNITSFGQRQLSQATLDSYTVKYRHESDNPLLNLRANLWATNLEHKRGNAFPTGIRDHSAVTIGGDIANTLRFDTSFGAFVVDGGVEFRNEHAKAPDLIDAFSQTSRGPNGYRTLAAMFGKVTYEPIDWLKLSAGARYDDFSAEGEGVASIFPERKGSRLSPNFGIVVKPMDGLQLFAEYKEGYRPPSLRELYWEIYNLQVNPDLKGEVSKNWEFGANLLRENVLAQGDKLRFKAAYFRNRYDDYIVVQDVPGVYGQQHFANIDHANYRGYELSGSYDAGWFFAEGNYTRYLTIEYCEQLTGCTVPKLDSVLANVTPPTFVPPKWSGSATAGVRLFDQKLTLGGRAYFSSTRYGTEWPPENPNAAGLIGMNFTWPQFVVYDIFASYKFSEDTLLNFSIENITDQYYYGPLATTGMPSPGAHRAAWLYPQIRRRWPSDDSSLAGARPCVRRRAGRQLDRLVCRRPSCGDFCGDIWHRENRRRGSGCQ